MSTIYRNPLQPRPGARARRVTRQPEPQRQPVTNAEWREQRRRARETGFLARLIGKVKS